MSSIFLTQVGWPLKPIAWVLGEILNAIYEFINLFGLHNIAICIIIFTIITKMLMLPLTMKQQKYSRLQAKMSPELTKIQAKYKGKKDQESLQRSQAETQEVYSRYGTSPLGGCLPLIISLPIMFALYRVIYAVPAYVTDIGSIYTTIANSIISIPDHAKLVADFLSTDSIAATNEMASFGMTPEIISSNLAEIAKQTPVFAESFVGYRNSLIDILAKFNTANWDGFKALPEFANIASLQSVVNGESVSTIQAIIDANNLFGLNILDNPQWNGISVVIPILAVASQFVQGKLQQADTERMQKNVNADNPMGNSAKTMTTIMPLISGVFCLMMPIAVGLYWIASAVVTVIQQLFINKYLDRVGVDELIEKNIQKSNKKKAKMGIDTGNKMARVAKISTKSVENKPYSTNSSSAIKSGETKSNYRSQNQSYSAGSIAANANLLAARNKDSKNKGSKDIKDNNDK